MSRPNIEILGDASRDVAIGDEPAFADDTGVLRVADVFDRLDGGKKGVRIEQQHETFGGTSESEAVALQAPQRLAVVANAAS